MRARFFGLDYALTAPVANGREGNLFFYLRELAGGGTLYGRAIAIAVASGLAVSLVGTRSTRLLAGLAGGTALLVCASYVPFFWQWDRFLLAALPLLIALAAMLVGTAAPASVQLAGVCLLAYGLASALQPRAFDRPNGASGEVETLRAIAARIEPNAVLIARTDPLLVARIFRADTDRLWLPIDRGEHRNLIRALHLEPYARARDAQAWVRDIIVNPFDPSALEGAVRDLLVSGRPVYFTAMQLREVPFGEAVFAMLRQRFTLRPSVTDPTTGLMQVLPNAMPTRPDG